MHSGNARQSSDMRGCLTLLGYMLVATVVAQVIWIAVADSLRMSTVLTTGGTLLMLGIHVVCWVIAWRRWKHAYDR